MSWDVVLFSYKEKLESPEDINEDLFDPTNFGSILESHFPHVEKDGDHRTTKGKGFSIEYFSVDEEEGVQTLNLYGENGLFELIPLAKKHNWQIIDTGLGQMIDLDNPANNGYENFQNYLKHVLRKGS